MTQMAETAGRLWIFFDMFQCDHLPQTGACQRETRNRERRDSTGRLSRRASCLRSSLVGDSRVYRTGSLACNGQNGQRTNQNQWVDLHVCVSERLEKTSTKNVCQDHDDSRQNMISFFSITGF